MSGKGAEARGPGPRESTERRATRKSLTNVGGPSRFTGDPALREVMMEAFAVSSGGEVEERRNTHGFHAWPARLHPHTARTLIAVAPPGAIADPFMGGGTVPLEALFAGRLGIGNDLNPVGLEVAWVRTRRLDASALQALRETTRKVIKLAVALREEARVPAAYRDRVGYALDPQALREVWSLATVLGDGLARTPADPSLRITRAALSSVLVKLSRLVSDSVSKVDPARLNTVSPRGRVDHWLKKRVLELSEQLAETSRAIPAGAPEPLLSLGDARHAPATLPPIAAIVSSPPYPGVYDYVDHHRLRMLALDLPLGPMFERELGSRRESERHGLDVGRARYVEGLSQVLASWSRTLVEGGFVAFVIGDGQVDRKVTPVVPLLERAAATSGLRIRAVVSQPRPVFGQRGAERRSKDEHLVWLERHTATPQRLR